MDKKKKKFLIGTLLIVCATGYLIKMGIDKSSVYYLKVGELLDKGSTIYNEEVRVEGKVVKNSIKKGASPLKVDFSITDDKDNTIDVHYDGVIPDMFEDERDVVIEGKFLPSKLFMAHTLMTSCPSKYEAELNKGGSTLKQQQKKTTIQ